MTFLKETWFLVGSTALISIVMGAVPRAYAFQGLKVTLGIILMAVLANSFWHGGFLFGFGMMVGGFVVACVMARIVNRSFPDLR